LADLPAGTAVPFPVLGPNGYVLPSESAILTGVQSDIDGAFGGGLNQALSTPQGQIASSETAILGDSFAMFAYFANQVDPAYSSGRMQDAIARIYFITRIPGAPTVQLCICSGLDGVKIPVGAIVQDPDQNFWICSQPGTIVGGTVTLNFSCAVNGPTPGPVSLTIYQSIFGWDSVTPTGDAVLGQNVETRQAFETRRSLSTGINSMGPLPAILGAVLQVPGVLDAFVTENDEDGPLTIGGATVAGHSLYVSVIGGVALDVATAIWSRKMPGCAYNGNTTITVVDPSPEYVDPKPSYAVTFEIPPVLNFVAQVVISNNSNVPSDALTQIQNAIVQAFAGLDGGPRAKIGSTVFASRYYAPVALLGSWALIIDIQIGVLASGASFHGSISGTTLTVSSVSAGALAAGQLLQDITGVLANGTTIVSGSGSTWTVSIAQTVAAEDMTATNLLNDQTVNINQAPGISASNINLVLV
jgi:hypothetical protein